MMDTYWMLGVQAPSGSRRAVIGQQPDLSEDAPSGLLNWYSGAPFDNPLSSPLEFSLDPRGGDYVTDFFPPPIPLMSVRMLDGLAQAGVDNIIRYDAVISTDDGQPLSEPFKAINIIGRIECADLDASDCEVDDPDDPVGVDFDSLVIDPERAGGALFFRLHEAVNGIVVHDSVKQYLETVDLRGIVFTEPENWIG